MIFSIAIYSSPQNAQASYSAYRFAEAALLQGHKIHRIFFYHQAIHNASAFSVSAQDEINLTTLWQTLAKENGFELNVCIAAAITRGLLDTQEANRYQKPSSNIAAQFELSGLGQFVEACASSDRLVTFGY